MSKESKELKILIGADPELFLKNAKGEYVSAHDVLPGTKLEPYVVNKGAIQVDGLAAEFNIDPASNVQEFTGNIKEVVTSLKNHAAGLTLCVDPFAKFERSYFQSLPEATRELGCNPDFNAYTGQVNPSPDRGDDTICTAAGHMHFGWRKDANPMDPSHFLDCRTVVKQLDFYLGLYSLIWDPDNTRRSLYGKAGAFRPKSYGVEYRVLSNAWLHTTHLQQWVYNAGLSAINTLLLGGGRKSMKQLYGTYAQECIDNNVTDWWRSDKGQHINMSTGLLYPDIRGLKIDTDIAKKMHAQNDMMYGSKAA